MTTITDHVLVGEPRYVRGPQRASERGRTARSAERTDTRTSERGREGEWTNERRSEEAKKRKDR